MTEKVNVLSLFDGLSGCRLALDTIGIKYDNYYASEVDKHAVGFTSKKFPDTIHLGDVRNVTSQMIDGKVFILAGGSPCQSFSFAGKMKGMSTKCEQEITTLEQYLKLKEEDFEFEGQSYLFWEFVRLKEELKPKYWFLENVQMIPKWKNVITRALGIEPIEINSALVSAQNRVRNYWHNINSAPSGLFGDMKCMIPQPKDRGILLKHILQSDVPEKYFLSDKMMSYFKNRAANKQDQEVEIQTDLLCIDTNGRVDSEKTGTVNASYSSGPENYGSRPFILNTNSFRIRRLTPIEVCRLQTIPDDYFFDKENKQMVSDTQIYRMCGNGWTNEVIAYIFSFIKKD